MRIKDGFRLRDVMGQATVIGEGAAQVDFTKLVILNSSAEFLWKEVEGKEFDADMLASLLIDRYGIEGGLAHKDAETVMSQWKEAGLTE